MSPRGKAIPQLRERLIQAGERVLVAGGPGAVTARAVAGEAGVATGLLYHHFADFDGFLAALVLDRFRTQAGRMAGFSQRAGSRTVEENLTDAAMGLLESTTLAVADLVRARVGLSVKVMGELDAGAAGMPDVQRAIVAYLEEERRLGRIAAGADTETGALMLVGAVHHLLLLHGSGLPQPARAARRIAAAVLTGLTERAS
ncbi:MAG TPA: TetR/AcrR family transcriptional regulator [Streptosporangiaceae bacterium]